VGDLGADPTGGTEGLKGADSCRRPFRGKIDLDIRDSTPDRDAFLPDKVVFDVADDAYVDVEHELAAALARD
jgi:hypothetical protein